MRQDGAVKGALPTTHQDNKGIKRRITRRIDQQMKKIHLLITKRAKEEA